MNAVRPCLIALGVVLGGCQSETLVDRSSPEGGEPAAPARFKRPQAGEDAPAGGEWWKSFRDPVLNELVEDVAPHNPDVGAALAHVDQAYAILGITGANRFPVVTGEAAYNNDRDSPNSLRFEVDELEFENYRLATGASWEIDLWGRIRGAYARDRFKAEAAREEFSGVLLSIRATLARQYFALRSAESEIAILHDAVVARAEELRLQESLASRGSGTDADLARAATELETARAEAQGVERTRGKLENALATLTGRAPSEFDLPPRSGIGRLPQIPSGVPSALLARRPDLRAAENTLLAASQEVGIAKVEFLPRLTLTGTGGLASLRSSDLFAGGDSFFYSLGPRIDVPLFQANRAASTTAEAKAKWDEAAEIYRGALLNAVREADDSLIDIQVLRIQAATQQRAVDAAARSTELARKRFDQGAASFFEVVDAQRTELQARRTLNALRGEQAAATVNLAQALGGAW